MKTFYCDNCNNLVYFENVTCLKCEHALGFLPELLDITALERASHGAWLALAEAARGRTVRLCRNGVDHQVCNWVLPVEDASEFCMSCRLNQIIPDLNVPDHLVRWRKVEQAKRRLIYTLLKLRLPLTIQSTPGKSPLQFCFLADSPGGPSVMTGHKNGVITLNLAEADDAERERRRIHLHEPYRTLLGHFRHEIAHYYWDQLIAPTTLLERFRELFGDETQEYGASLKRYHEQGPPARWQEEFVSAYASAHPWEDWAETWAHYLHIVDTIETAAGFGITLKPSHPDAKAMTTDLTDDPASIGSFAGVLKKWIPLTAALNSLNRGMGLADLYPFVLSNRAVTKLTFMHDVIHNLDRARS